MAAFPRIDRAAHLRKDTSRLMSALDAPETLLVPVFRDKNLFTPGGEDRAALLTVAQAGSLVDSAAELVWLGLLDGKNCFALDLSSSSESLLTPFGRLGDLRFDAGLIPAEDTEVLAYARGMLNWHRRHRHCGSCGELTKPREGGHVRECASEDLKTFPRTDPCVMVLVTHGDRCVLARQPAFPKGMYAATAGFVEPGESVEDAVLREVKEELGLDVDGVRYFRSQAWPFPASLMIGFWARARGDALVVDHEELEEARWFGRDELRNPQGFFYPPSYSLAHHLIRGFLEE